MCSFSSHSSCLVPCKTTKLYSIFDLFKKNHLSASDQWSTLMKTDGAKHLKPFHKRNQLIDGIKNITSGGWSISRDELTNMIKKAMKQDHWLEENKKKQYINNDSKFLPFISHHSTITSDSSNRCQYISNIWRSEQQNCHQRDCWMVTTFNYLIVLCCCSSPFRSYKKLEGKCLSCETVCMWRWRIGVMEMRQRLLSKAYS